MRTARTEGDKEFSPWPLGGNIVVFCIGTEDFTFPANPVATGLADAASKPAVGLPAKAGVSRVFSLPWELALVTGREGRIASVRVRVTGVAVICIIAVRLVAHVKYLMFSGVGLREIDDESLTEMIGLNLGGGYIFGTGGRIGKGYMINIGVRIG